MSDILERLSRVLDDLAAERDPRDRPFLLADEAKLAEMAALLKAARDEPATPDAGILEALMDEITGGETMDKVMIVLDGSAADARVVELAGNLLTGKDVEVTLLHVVPRFPLDDQGWDDAVVLEGYLAAERCDTVMAPLMERLHNGFAPARQSTWAEPRLVPRHLIQHADARDVIDRCSIAQQRRDSLDLLAASAERLRQRGIDVSRITRDSAIGNPADIVRATATYLGVDLVILSDVIAGFHRRSPDDSGWERIIADVPCPVLVVPTAHHATSSEDRRTTRPNRAAPA